MCVHTHGISLNVLLFCIRISTDGEAKNKKKKKKSPFIRAISQVFGEHLHVYIQAQDETLSHMLDDFAKEFKSSLIFPEQTAIDDDSAKEHTCLACMRSLENTWVSMQRVSCRPISRKVAACHRF
eukprot:m.182074 g.182074  ORF g.182074 m.182074 type:complete len:125 (+) comp13586_c0_seq3:1235-1609(+)